MAIPRFLCKLKTYGILCKVKKHKLKHRGKRNRDYSVHVYHPAPVSLQGRAIMGTEVLIVTPCWSPGLPPQVSTYLIKKQRGFFQFQGAGSSSPATV